ncbi:RNA polymerase sigma-70 factor, ECF subfamily [Fodinibius roseus]|uniref:RNA polymerase sigma-70 factor, ECF subfamily n=1 Tax=Fodinibius roseus TaxID=1194090 RepID=A0A1M5FX12_9BACT|nr:RNA polymerase sigma-70 factor [Fodinibius roseus]SHF95989.1 RNA polymerase sigma-70 factor, ECF subfamily [Fodinibius roseus]
MGLTEKQLLVKRLKKSDRKAFDRLYRIYEEKLYAFAYKLTRSHEEAREIVQYTFFKIWEKRSTIDENKNFEAFLFTIARNKVYNKARKRTYVHAYEHYLKNKLSHQQNNGTEESLQYRETWEVVENAIEQLPPRRKEVFTLSRMNGLTNKEIAHLTDTSVSNIENHIHKALKVLRIYLSNHGIISLFIVIVCFSWFLI